MGKSITILIVEYTHQNLIE